MIDNEVVYVNVTCKRYDFQVVVEVKVQPKQTQNRIMQDSAMKPNQSISSNIDRRHFR